MSIFENGSIQDWHEYCRILYIPMFEYGYGVIALKESMHLGLVSYDEKKSDYQLLSISSMMRNASTNLCFRLLYEILSNNSFCYLLLQTYSPIVYVRWVVVFTFGIDGS